MTDEIDEVKLKMMWDRIIAYEKENCIGGSHSTAVKNIVSIIDEVYRQCF